MIGDYGRFSAEGSRAWDRIERLDTAISDVEGRQPPSYWQEQLESIWPGPAARDGPEPLEVFDPARRCPKCSGKAKVRWLDDRLERICRRCRFTWEERSLDAETNETAPSHEG